MTGKLRSAELCLALVWAVDEVLYFYATSKLLLAIIVRKTFVCFLGAFCLLATKSTNTTFLFAVAAVYI